MRFSYLSPLALASACVLVGALQSCATIVPSEELIRSSIAGAGAPEWIGGNIVQIPGSVTFVGRGGGINVLDERHAFDEAMGHARAQLAQYVATQVNAEACLRDYSSGARFLSFDRHQQGDGEHVDQWLRSRVTEIADVIVGGVAASEQHWEQWNVSNDKPTGFMTWRTPGTHSFSRYKCWVLTRVDQTLIDGYVRATLAAVSRDDDSKLAVDTLNAQSWELQRLRERVHYGRRFRLVAKEDCLHYRPICDFERLHPEWAPSEYRVGSGSCSFCSDSPHSH